MLYRAAACGQKNGDQSGPNRDTMEVVIHGMMSTVLLWTEVEEAASVYQRPYRRVTLAKWNIRGVV